MKDYKKEYQKEKRDKKEKMEIVALKNELEGEALKEQVNQVMKVSELWSLGYDRKEIAIKLGLLPKEINKLINERGREWSVGIKKRITNKLLSMVDLLIDKLDDPSKIQEAKLKDLADTIDKLVRSTGNINGKVIDEVPETDRMKENDLLTLGEKAMKNLGEVEVSEIIRKVKMKTCNNKNIAEQSAKKIAVIDATCRDNVNKKIVEGMNSNG